MYVLCLLSGRPGRKRPPRHREGTAGCPSWASPGLKGPPRPRVPQERSPEDGGLCAWSCWEGTGLEPAPQSVERKAKGVLSLLCLCGGVFLCFITKCDEQVLSINRTFNSCTKKTHKQKHLLDLSTCRLRENKCPLTLTRTNVEGKHFFSFTGQPFKCSQLYQSQ